MRNKVGKSVLSSANLLGRRKLPAASAWIHSRSSPTETNAEMAPNKPKLARDYNESLLDYNHFLNDFSKRREPSAIRELNKKNSTERAISFAGGLPNPSTFPFEEINLRLTDGSNIPLSGATLRDALQYLPTQGYPPLLEKLRQLQWTVHSPPMWDNTDVIITSGSQDALCKVMEMSLEEGEPIIVQYPVYSGTGSVLKPFKPEFIPIQQDENGMRSDQLRYELQRRYTPKEMFKKSKGVPKLLYVNTTGANPTGLVLTAERKREIYQIACEYNLIILEDDPYYFLLFKDDDSNEYPSSFLSMDTEGRVLRFDSFSKVISPGLRVGFLTGPKQLLKRVEYHMQVSILHASSLSQVILDKILDNWGFDGLYDHFRFIQQFYRSKRDALISLAHKYLTGLAEWNEPIAGMFLWIKIKGVPDVYNLVFNECLKEGVSFVSGHAYTVYNNEPSAYIRACYTLPTIEEMEIGMKRLAQAIQREQKRYQKLNVIENTLS